jgi:regulator-associated protein of mTOR
VAFALGSLIGNQAISNAITARLPALNESRKNCGPEMNLPPQRFSLSPTNENGIHRSFERVTISSQSLPGGIIDQESCQVDENTSFEAEGEPCLSPEDRTRLSLDLIVARQLISLASDASPAVRYETVLALGCCIEKYLPIFAEVANDHTKVSSDSCRVETKTDQELTFMPSLVSQKFSAAVGDENARDIRSVWGVIRDLQCRDPFPIVSDTAKVVVSFVHEYMLLLLGTRGESKNMAAMNRIHSMLQMNSSSADNPANISKKLIDPTMPIPHQVTSFDANKLTIRRQSFGKTERHILDRHDSLSRSYHGRATVRPEFPSSNDYLTSDNSQADYQSQYKLPRSQFISSGFAERRNTLIRSHIKSLAEKFEIISRDNVDNYKKIQSSGSFSSLSNSRDFFSDLESEEEESAKAAALETEISTKKKGLQLKQRTLLHKEGCATSTILKFHPYEPALLVCDASDVVSLWNISDAKEYCSFHNGNDKESRLTTISWVNEESKSLLITGATDGTLRIWGGLLRDDCSLSNEAPNLISAFLAEPDIVAGTKGSDLIMEWQQCTGKLVTAGSSALLRCWDIETEKCCNEIDRNSAASVTALCTAWDSLFLDNENKLNPTIGPDILVTGYSDGSIRIFDTRVDYRNLSSSVSMGHSFSSRQRKRKVIQYHEHSSWIVNTCFTGFGAKYEVSECIQCRRVQLFPPLWLGITN